jgi:hypothetical protein
MGDPGGIVGHVDLSADEVNKINLGFASRAERFIISPDESLLKTVVATLGLEK